MPEALAPEVSGRARGGIRLWAVDLGSSTGRLLSLGERYRLSVSGGHGGGDQQRQAAGIALRLLLAGYLGLEAAGRPFVLSTAGKPSIAPAPHGRQTALHFNLAHCDGWALIGVSTEGPIGVDIETERRPRISEQRRAKLVGAARAVAPLDILPDGQPEAQFVRAWVRLEALAKATGEGLGALLARLDEVILSAHAGRMNGTGIMVRDVHLEGPGLAAAVSGSCAALATGPPPAASRLPLDDAWLGNWIASAQAPQASSQLRRA